MRLAQYLANTGALAASLEQINTILKANPASVPGLRAKAEILARQGHSAELEEVLTKLEKASPETGLGAFGKGRLYKSQKKYPEAVAAFEEALSREPDSILALSELITTQIAMGDTDAAITRLKALLEKDPAHKAAHDLLGVVYMARKDYPLAEAEFSKQLKVNPDSSVVYTQLAEARLKQGNTAGAEQAIKDGLARLVNDERLTLALASLYSQQGKLDKAAAILHERMLTAPDNPRYVLGYAQVLERQGHYGEAITTYEQFLDKTPDNVLATNNLAALLADHKQDEQSLKKARVLTDKLAGAKQPALLDTVGWVDYRLGDYGEAIKVLSGVVAQAPDVPVFNYHLGMAYLKQGNKQEARKYLSKAVGEKDTYFGVDEARKALAELK
jgi:tetratricopeptide (TPR) repeat protein